MMHVTCILITALVDYIVLTGLHYNTCVYILITALVDYIVLTGLHYNTY